MWFIIIIRIRIGFAAAIRVKNKILALKNSNEPSFHKQPCET